MISLKAILIAACVCVAAGQRITPYPTYNLTFNWWYWCDANHTIIVDSARGIWRSANAALTLTPLNFTSYEIIQDNVNPNMLRFSRSDGTFSDTHDCGATFASYPDTSAHVHHFTVVSSQASGYLLATSVLYGCDLSTDFGRTWATVHTGTGLNCQFGRKTLHDKTYDPHMIYIVDDYALKVVYPIGTPARTVPNFDGVIGIAWSQNYMFAGRDVNGYFELYVSSNAGSGADMTWSRAEVPRRRYVHFFFLDDQSGGLWLGASETGVTGDLFTSSYDGVQFKPSITDVVVTFNYDFTGVGGIEGIYIANVKRNATTQSFITFNDGGTWGLIPAPAGSGCLISQGCSLHLHGNSQFSVDWDGAYQGYASVYSSGSAIGLVLAVGNTGRSLSTTNVNTYLSRDAGLTWTQIFNGSQIYEFGDHGGILVMADNTKPTDIINYSLDEALTWNTYKLPAPVKIENIIVESDMGTAFVVLTTNSMFGLDFSTLHSRICVDADYENWTPSDGVSTQRCVLGRDFVYSRRIRDRQCFNARTTEHLISQTNCSCAVGDYECDYGFEQRTGDDNNGLFSCVWVEPGVDPRLMNGCTPGVKYNVTQGYKLAAGDSCEEQGGKNLLPVERICSSNSSTIGSSTTGSSTTGSSTAGSSTTGYFTTGSSTTGATPSNNGLGGGAIFGILVLVLVVLAIVALIVGYKLKKLPEGLSSKIDTLIGGKEGRHDKKYTLLGADDEEGGEQ